MNFSHPLGLTVSDPQFPPRKHNRAWKKMTLNVLEVVALRPRTIRHAIEVLIDVKSEGGDWQAQIVKEYPD